MNDETTTPRPPRAHHVFCAARDTRFLFDRRPNTDPDAHSAAATARDWGLTASFKPSSPRRQLRYAIGLERSHQHRPEGNLPCPRLSGQYPQVAAGRIDVLSSLWDAGNDDGGAFF